MIGETVVHDPRVLGCCTHLEERLSAANKRADRLEKVLSAAEKLIDRKNDMKDYPWPGEIDDLEEAIAAARLP